MPKLLQVVSSGKPPAMLYNKAIESGSNFDHSNYNYGIIFTQPFERERERENVLHKIVTYL